MACDDVKIAPFNQSQRLKELRRDVDFKMHKVACVCVARTWKRYVWFNFRVSARDTRTGTTEKITQDSSQIRIAFSVRGLIYPLVENTTWWTYLTAIEMSCLCQNDFLSVWTEVKCLRQIGPIRERDSLVYSRYLNTILFLTIKGRVYLRSN